MRCVIIFLLILLSTNSYSQLAKYKGKFLGNIIAYSIPSNFNQLWNQVTSENGSKWGTCDRGNGNYDFSNSDLAFNYAKQNNFPFKFHTLMWGSQTPSYLRNADPTTIMNAIKNWFQAVEDHYKTKGTLDMIDVLNEPVNTDINREIPNLKQALTMGYQSEPANQNDRNNPYGWAIWPFQLARKHFPNSILLINEYNIEHNWNNCRPRYIEMINAIKNAPNLTDGRKNLIDGVGLQCHGINNLSAEAFKACIDEIWQKTGLPIYISEFDATADPNEATQRDVYSRLIPIAWEHPHVAGITLWGYIQGETWIGGNGQVGPGGTDSGILYSPNYSANPLGDRPAMQWLRSYFNSLPDLPCKPDPAPFAGCDKVIVKIMSPSSGEVYTVNDTIHIRVSATTENGNIEKVSFYVNEELIGEANNEPYTYSYIAENSGIITIKVVARDNNGETGEESISIKVNKARAPYGGSYRELPGRIEAEEFDEGGNGVSYYDNSAGSETGVGFRSEEDVDIEECKDEGGGYNIGWWESGEWLEYSVEVKESGEYRVIYRVACELDGRKLRMYVDGEAVRDIEIPNSGGWQNWVDVVEEGIRLESGRHVIRLEVVGESYVNLNYIDFELSTVGMKEKQDIIPQVKVYPNPLNNLGILKYEGKNLEVKIYNVYGQLKLNFVTSQPSGIIKIDTKKLGSSGIYKVIVLKNKKIIFSKNIYIKNKN